MPAIEIIYESFFRCHTLLTEISIMFLRLYFEFLKEDTLFQNFPAITSIVCYPLLSACCYYYEF